jgi:hypothetical protein
LKEYFKSKGASLKDSANINDNNQQLQEFIKNIGLCLSSASNETELEDIEAVLNSLLSLIIISPDENTKLVSSFCESILKIEYPNHVSQYFQHKFGLIKLRILGNLFHGLIGSNKHRYTVFIYLIKCSLVEKNLQYLPANIDVLKKLMQTWQISIEETQYLYRLMFETLSQLNDSQGALHILYELLSTYNKETASKSRDDANKYI